MSNQLDEVAEKVIARYSVYEAVASLSKIDESFSGSIIIASCRVSKSKTIPPSRCIFSARE